MGKNVYANCMEIAAEASNHMVIAAMPDVCLSPPPPPAGPIPVPYPDTSKSRDLKQGSKKVEIGGKPICLGSKSHYRSKPLGDEASTMSFGANVIDHTNGGKTHCQAFSMNVKVEKHGVTRTGDITTSNHMLPQPAGCPVPMPQLAGVAPPTLGGGEEPTCECCGGPVHSAAQKAGASMPAADWYNPPFTPKIPPTARDRRAMNAIADANAAIALSKDADCDLVHGDDSDPCAKHYAMEEPTAESRSDFADMMSPQTSEAFLIGKYGPTVGARVFANGARLRAAEGLSVAHKTPLAAGGCPVGTNNTSPVMSQDCAYLEGELGKAQGVIKGIHQGHW